MSSPETIRRIVTRFDRLKQLTDHAARLRALNDRLIACLPDDLAAHTRLAAVRDGCLVLQADGGAWATRLRYQSPEILAKLAGSEGFEAVRSIRVRNAQREVAPEPAAPARRARMGAAAAASIGAQAETTEDPVLREALRRLAGSGTGRD